MKTISTIAMDVRGWFATLILLGVCGQASGADTVQLVTIDVAANPRVLHFGVKTGDVQVTVKNFLPDSIAKTTITADTVSINVVPSPLTYPGTTPPGQAALDVEAVDPCQGKVAKLLGAPDHPGDLQKAKTEKEIGALEKEVLALGGSNGACSAKPDDAKKALDTFRSQTSATLDKVTLAQGEELTVSVERQAGVGSDVPEAPLGDYVIATPPQPSQWLTYYGFNYISDGDQNFFAKANAGSSPATYTITPDANRHSKQFAPSVYFMWLPAKNFDYTALRAFAWRDSDSGMFGGLTAGLGFDTSNPVAFLGYGVGWGYNVMLTGGVAMHKEKRLLGQYNSGDVVSENLTADQLLDDTYKPRFYIGVAFRFGSNPFGSGGSGDKKTADTTKTK
jgi:hypothetical protein